MKKTRKVLSLVLAILVAFGSMPVVYTGTAAADAIPYAEATGTIDNPTRPISESGEYSQSDANHLTALQKSLNFIFYQTIDNEYFGLSQVVQMQKNIGWGETVTVVLNSYNFDTDDTTNAFFNKHEGTYSWTASTDQATGTPFPGSFEITGTLMSRPTYGWNLDVVFKGHSAGESGEINTGYTQILDYTTTVEETATSYPTAIATTVKILDARELIKEIAEAEYILENPDDYTEKYLSSVEATLNSIPEDLKDFSKVYDQSVIDSYTKMLKDISLNSADYREYNQVYKSLKSITNAKGAFTEESFIDFKAEIDKINDNLPKNLDKTKQATVDAATQALRDAYNILVATDLSENKVPYGYDAGDKRDIVIQFDNTVYYFMQTKDNQVFSYDQNMLVYRTGGSTARKVRGILLDETGYHGSSSCADASVTSNGTSTFISHLDSSSYTSTNGYTDENGAAVSAKEFTCVTETRNDNWRANQDFDASFVTADGRFGYNKTLDDYGVFGSGPFEYRSAVIRPMFRGNSAGTYGELVLNYTLRAGFSTNSGIGYSAQQWHTHTRTTLNITDVRQLISAVAEAEEALANPGSHSEAYILALQAAVDSVPVEMLRGVEYHTQAEVDKLYNDITSIPEQVADYSEFVEAFNMMTSLNKDKYTEDSYNTFLDEIYAINQNLAKNLRADNQATVDAAVDALYAAYNKLVSRHLNEDSVFTQDDIDEDLGNSPLEFSISSTQNNFVQIVDGQKFAIRTEITARKTRTNYNCSLLALRFSSVTADTTASICAGRASPDAGCHNGESILINQSDIVLSGVTGVNSYAANDAGDIGEHNTWVNTKGVALSTNGIFNDPSNLTTSDSSAYAEMYYTGVSGNQESFNAKIDANIALRLGWSYSETFLGIEGDSTRRHVHIPVSIQITDARALHSLYNEVEDIISGETEATYTLGSLLNLYNAYVATNEGLANGEVYVPQEEANAEYAKLKAAYDALQEGADYSEYFEAYVKAQEIISTGNDDGYGNKLYDDETFNNFKTIVKEIDNGLDKNLSSDENDEIGTATSNLNTAIADLEKTKYADYTELEKVIAEAEKITNASEGTYTNETLDVLKEALNNANALDRELSASEQETVDAITSALESAVEDIEYKADYSEFDKAYTEVNIVVKNPDDYEDDVVEAAKKALEEADKLNKDLPDTAANREIIAEATEVLQKVTEGVFVKADYSVYNQYIDICYNQVDKSQYTYENYTEFIEIVNKVDAELPKDLPASEQAQVTAAEQALLDAYMKLLEQGKTSNPDSIGEAFTQDAITGEYTNGVIKFSVSSSEYNFTQTINDEKILIKTDLSVSSANANYTVTLDSLKISSLDGNEIAALDSKANCYNSANVSVNQAENLFCKENIEYNVVTGVTMYPADGNGDMAHFTAWENTAGVALSSGGVLNASTTLTTEASSATSQYTYTSVGGGDTETKARSHTYVLRLGWSETDSNGTTTQHHAHIPVTINISDARALNSTYQAYMDFINAGNDGTYTDKSFEAATDIMNSVNTDIVNGKGYFTQEEINAESAKLADALGSLQEKADYSGYDEAYEQLEEILNNPDNYTKETVDAAQAAKDAADELGKDQPATNQDAVNEVINGMEAVVENKQEKADYSGYDEAYEQLEDILSNPDNYTKETVDAAQAAKDAADALGKDQPATNQDAVNEVINGMEAVVENKQEKADYSGYDEAYEQLEDILSNPDNYTKETVDAAQAAKDAADALGKDQPATNQDAVNEVINGMKDAVADKQEKADYSGYDEAYEQLEDILSNPDNYTKETVDAAQAAKDAADELGKDQPATNQDAVNEVINGMEAVVENKQEKADYTDYNNAKDEADNLINEDENGNPIYEDDIFNAYKDAIKDIDDSLSKDLPESEQSTVDEKTQALKDLRTELDATNGYEETVVDQETTVDEFVKDVVEQGGYNPDEIIIQFKDYTGKELAGEDFVGTGSTMRVILKSTGELLEYKMFIVMGDVDGDGDIDRNDYQRSVDIGLEIDVYAEENYYFFIANDVDEDGVIDVFDAAIINLMVSKLA